VPRPIEEPHHHHYAPQFFLRNFACDSEGRKVNTIMKHGLRAVWARRSIENIGFEHDLYVHMSQGRPVSVERAINRKIETPISRTDTWQKIVSGRTDALDLSDKPVLYALIRHLEVRTPHYFETGRELAELAASNDSGIDFTDDEREMYAELRADSELAKAMFSRMSSTLDWTEAGYRGAFLAVWRSPIRLRSSTTPVMPQRAPMHPALHLPLPGMVPYQLLLTLNTTTAVVLIQGDFDGAFSNVEIPLDAARMINRHFVGQFSHFPHVSHLITERERLIEDMTWASYTLGEENSRRLVFERKK
jgi:hypothetical protein